MNFPKEVAGAARKAMLKWDIPASVTMAQWALESGFGKHMPASSNNPFGIKARAGEPFVSALTREVFQGKEVRIFQKFRKFNSLDEAFDLHGKLLATGAAYAAARKVRRDGLAFAKALQGHYATDPMYGALLTGIINRNGLLKFDKRSNPVMTEARPMIAPNISLTHVTSAATGLMGTAFGAATMAGFTSFTPSVGLLIAGASWIVALYKSAQKRTSVREAEHRELARLTNDKLADAILGIVDKGADMASAATGSTDAQATTAGDVLDYGLKIIGEMKADKIGALKDLVSGAFAEYQKITAPKAPNGNS